MGMNETPSGERVHIGFFGRRNAGKSSVMNAVTGQKLAVVSDVKGTTTDPVYKSMELLPLGPVMLIDTAGIDDEGELGKMRVEKSIGVLNKTDIAVLVIDGTEGLYPEDRELIKKIQERRLPLIVVINKADLKESRKTDLHDESIEKLYEEGRALSVSAATGEGIEELKEKLARVYNADENKKRLVGDLIAEGDLAVLVIPIDKAAPKGRLILPQQQTIRDILESGAYAVTVRDTELPELLLKLGDAPKLVITDSQVFKSVSEAVPDNIPLTSFSILFARYKGSLEDAVTGASKLSEISDGDRILISEGCTHHRQCNDIGTVKLPGMIRKFTKKEPEFHFTSGTEFPEELGEYKLVVHCGGCMLNEKEMQRRIEAAKRQGIPVTNYGILIAYIQGILKRSVSLFPDISKIL